MDTARKTVIDVTKTGSNCDEYVFVKGTITVSDPFNVAYNKKLAFKNNAPFITWITIIHLLIMQKI